MKINNFRGELTDISAKKEALIDMIHTCIRRIVSSSHRATASLSSSCNAEIDIV